MKYLLLARHAQAMWPRVEEACYHGWSDAPLTPRGRQQAQALAERLAHEWVVSAIYSSDLGRAIETAGILGECLQLPVISRSGLRELSFGEWEGMSYGEIVAHDPEKCRSWVSDPLNVAPPGGETLGECASRVKVEMEAIRHEQVGDGTVLVVGHGGPLRLIVCHLLGMPEAYHWRVRLDLCSLSICEWLEDMPVLTRLNDTAHTDERRKG